jgi:2-keto-4-pentenoate hydratase/2-oxohepta-3-ene-1,7-dioic acid hydratase in catechol pathway
MQFIRLNLAPEGQFARIVEPGRAELWSNAPFLGGKRTQTIVSYTEREVLAPVKPGKVLCVGRNYAAHAKELGNEVPKEPLLFLKPSSSVIGPNQAVVLPPQSQRVEHEIELAVIIGRALKNAAPEEAAASVFGYTCGFDVTARDLQRSDAQWSRAKGFDTFCPLGPWIETELDPSRLQVQCHVNGGLRQSGNTEQMTWSVFSLLSIMSQAMTLEPGDVILTGTPEGVGPLVNGDTLSGTIQGIGTLTVCVTA